VIFDDDAFYLASALAEVIVQAGGTVTIVTPEDAVASWSTNTLEFRHIQKRLYKLGVTQVPTHNIVAALPGGVRIQHNWSGVAAELKCDAIVSVTARLPDDTLFAELQAREDEWAAVGVQNVECIGDALAPGLIAHAVYAGHRYAQTFDCGPQKDVPFRRHLPVAQLGDLPGR
jgi:dimethylamine/trimethylamine dehydrogenase